MKECYGSDKYYSFKKWVTSYERLIESLLESRLPVPRWTLMGEGKASLEASVSSWASSLSVSMMDKVLTPDFCILDSFSILFLHSRVVFRFYFCILDLGLISAFLCLPVLDEVLDHLVLILNVISMLVESYLKEGKHVKEWNLISKKQKQ